MADVFSKKDRSRIMSSIKGRNTKLETTFLGALSADFYPKGYRYKKHYKNLSGRPDIVFVKQKVAVFLDGDFWHGRNFSKLRLRLKKGFWMDKITRNIERDRKINRALRYAGWTVLRFWEGKIGKDPMSAIERIERKLKN